MKLLFYTDTHYKDMAPKGRIDDIMQSQFDELKDLLSIIREEDVDVLLHGGDVFDNRRPSHQLIVHLLDWFKLADIPAYTVIGNHDLLGYNLTSVKNSGLGVLLESGAMDRLDDLVWEKEKVVIKGIHSTLEFQDQYMFDEKYKDYTKIIVSHNYVIPAKSMPFGFIHPDNITTNADLVLCGHYHIPFDYKKGNTRWINTGSISRWKVTDRDNMPQALLITIDDGKLQLDYKNLPSAKPGHEIYDVDFIEVEKQHNKDIESFVKSLESTSFDAVDVEDMIKKVGDSEKVDKAVLDIVLNKITIAKDILK